MSEQTPNPSTRRPAIKPLAPANIPPIFAICFLAFVAIAVVIGRLPLVVLALYLVGSVVAFFAYAIDKSAAQKNRWRTPENTLHLFVLLGG